MLILGAGGPERLHGGNGGRMAVTLGLTEALIGITTTIERVRNDVDSAVRSKASVLITGEPGVGKEAIAREIHDQRGNPNLPFFRVDCQDGQGGSRAFKNLQVGHRPLLVDVDGGSPHHEPLRLPEELQAKLESYDWPGNINELRALASYLVRPTRSRPTAFASSHRRSHAVQGLGMTDALHNPTR